MSHAHQAGAVVLTLLAVACTALLILSFGRGLGRSTLLPAQRLRAILIFTIIAVVWFCLTGSLALAGFFSDFRATPPRLVFALLLPAVFLAAGLLRSRALPEALRHTPVTWLFYLQTFRIVVELILWRAYKSGTVPVQMTFDGRNFDILAGLTAPLAGWLWQRTGSRALGIMWNVAGLLLLLNIVVVAILSMPGPFRVFTAGPPGTLLTQFPFIYLPAVLVPIAYTAHVLSLRQLTAENM